MKKLLYINKLIIHFIFIHTTTLELVIFVHSNEFFHKSNMNVNDLSFLSIERANVN